MTVKKISLMLLLQFICIQACYLMERTEIKEDIVCKICEFQPHLKKIFNEDSYKKMHKLLCNHYFHEVCIILYLRRTSPACPICKTMILENVTEKTRLSNPKAYEKAVNKCHVKIRNIDLDKTAPILAQLKIDAKLRTEYDQIHWDEIARGDYNADEWDKIDKEEYKKSDSYKREREDFFQDLKMWEKYLEQFDMNNPELQRQKTLAEERTNEQILQQHLFNTNREAYAKMFAQSADKKENHLIMSFHEFRIKKPHDMTMPQQTVKQKQTITQAAVQKCCTTCSKPAENLKICSACKTIWYCSRECQKADWPHHKQLCKKK